MRQRVKGVELAYDDEGTGAPLVLVHGFPFQRGVWQPQRRSFASTRRVIAADLRGFGESEDGDGPVTMDRFAADLHALLECLATGPIVLFGHSMGGYVALAFARRFPEMLRGLGLVATRAGGDTPEGAAGRRALVERVGREGPQLVVEAMAPKMLAAGRSDPRRDREVRELMAPARAKGWSAALLAMAERPAAWDLLPRIAVPTLVVTGADDVLIPAEESRALAQAIPGARLELVAGAGHLVAWERPDELNGRVAAWLGAEAL